MDCLTSSEQQEFLSRRYAAGLFSFVPLRSGALVLCTGSQRNFVSTVTSGEALVQFFRDDFEKNLERIAREEDLRARVAQTELSDLDLDSLQGIRLGL